MKEFKLEENQKSVDGKFIYKTGLIFRAGEYPDKKFTMSPEELLDIEANFKPVPLDIEHVPSILDGKLGTLEAVKASEDGWELYGTAKVPVWLHEEVIGNDPLKVSCTWNREDKQLQKLALVRNPRVSDAALMAAFTNEQIQNGQDANQSLVEFFSWFKDNNVEFKEKTYHGRSLMQDVHDLTARSGAICKDTENKAKMNATADFVSEAELKTIQKLHDLSTAMGGKCQFMNDDSEKKYGYFKDSESKTNIGRKNMNIKDVVNFFKGLPDGVDETALLSGSEVVAEVTPKANDEIKGLKDEIASLKTSLGEFSKAKEAVVVEEPVVVAEVVETAETLALRKEVAELRQKNIVAEASAFADTQIEEGKAFPAEREALVALFSQAMIDDKATAVEVKFKNGEAEVSLSRVDALKAVYTNRKAHNLTKEELVGMSAVLKVKDAKVESNELEEVKNLAKAYADKRRGVKQ